MKDVTNQPAFYFLMGAVLITVAIFGAAFLIVRAIRVASRMIARRITFVIKAIRQELPGLPPQELAPDLAPSPRVTAALDAAAGAITLPKAADVFKAERDEVALSDCCLAYLGPRGGGIGGRNWTVNDGFFCRRCSKDCTRVIVSGAKISYPDSDPVGENS